MMSLMIYVTSDNAIDLSQKNLCHLGSSIFFTGSCYLFPGKNTVGMPSNVFVSVHAGPCRTLAAARAFHKSAIDNDGFAFVTAQKFSKICSGFVVGFVGVLFIDLRDGKQEMNISLHVYFTALGK